MSFFGSYRPAQVKDQGFPTFTQPKQYLKRGEPEKEGEARENSGLLGKVTISDILHIEISFRISFNHRQQETQTSTRFHVFRQLS